MTPARPMPDRGTSGARAPRRGVGVPEDRAGRAARRIAGALALLAGAFAVAGAGIASSHSPLLESTPADGALLPQSPDRVEARFAASLRDNGRNELRVIAPDGSRVDRDEARLEGDGTRISNRVEDDLPRGAYRVEWRASTADGHVGEGFFGFTVDPNAPAEDGGGGAVALLLAALGILGGAVLVVTLLLVRRAARAGA